jgi:CheY-like chemotaxis protein
MHGEIFVESELEKGTTFIVRLPQRINGSSAVLGRDVVENLRSFRFSRVSQIKRHAIFRDHMPYGSVLIVDDVEMNLFVAKLLLRPYGLTIDSASSGYEAIDRIKGGNVYDVIFMDHSMPGMDGIETTRIVRAMSDGSDYYKNLPVIVLTAHAVSGMKEMFIRNGFDDFMSKPIDTVILGTMLEKYIAKNKRRGSEGFIGGIGEPDPPHVSILEIGGLDVAKGIRQVHGSMEFYCEVLNTFCEDVEERVVAITECLDNNDIPGYTILVHALKSAAANIGADPRLHRVDQRPVPGGAPAGAEGHRFRADEAVEG